METFIVLSSLLVIALFFTWAYVIQFRSKPLPATATIGEWPDCLVPGPVTEAINLPEEKFVPTPVTREQILTQAQLYAQEYATKYPQTPFVTADFINQLLVLNNLPVLGKYASAFFQNKKLFERTSMQTPSTFPSAKRRIIKVYRYIGPTVSTAVN